MVNRIYLDNAATSWPKPESVYDAVEHYQRSIGVAAGRGGYQAAEEVRRTIQQTRLAIAKLLGADSPDNVVFTQNCTDSLNLALHGLLRAGDHVITTSADHNSVLRPLQQLSTRGVSVTHLPVDRHAILSVDQLASAIQPTTKLIAISHGSNVLGTVQPMQQVAEIAAERECILLVDAAQTLGHVPVDVRAWNVGLLAASGHKGLMGPLGTGVLYVADSLVSQLDSSRQGGTGTLSEELRQPESMPDKYETGNLNVPGIYGLLAGTRFVLDNQLPNSDHLLRLTEHLTKAIGDLPGVTLYSPANPCGIVSLNVEGYDPREVASLLETLGGIQCRAGLHCAPLMHKMLGTFEGGGTVRTSCGHFNSEADINTLIELIRELAGSSS